MAPSDDLKNHAASSHDFYALLDLSPGAADNEIRRAYRRTALKYHPDKIAKPTPEDIDKFHLLQIAYDVLSEPSVRQLYDNAREARDRKKRENEMLQGVRKKMKEDLEARERGIKRPRPSDGPVGFGGDVGGDSAEDKLEREIRRLAEDGKRRRQAKEELMRKEVLEEEERRDREEREREGGGEGEGAGTAKKGETERVKTGGTAVPEIDRTVKVRWVREGKGLDIDKDSLQSLFSTFGNVESAFTLKDKRQRIGEKREKKTVATGVIVYSSIVGAHAAVQDSQKQKGGEWDIIESVFWAGNKEPEHLAAHENRAQSPAPMQPPPGSAPSTPNKPTHFSKSQLHNFPGLNSAASTPSSTDGNNKNGGVRKVPSFASFSSAQTPNGSPAGRGAGLGPNSPSLEEITLIRLKNAERKRLEEQIRNEDEAAAAAEAEGK
ncbi:hypothetical protein FQN54_006965 [Arachnomyces sp. PD_36]|nr:hypothetical protein FQN54_006965 [Arachnomyces sp. PD_36]